MDRGMDGSMEIGMDRSMDRDWDRYSEIERESQRDNDKDESLLSPTLTTLCDNSLNKIHFLSIVQLPRFILHF